MTGASVTCPYCNAPLAGIAGPTPGARAACPRCGEFLPAALAAQLPSAAAPGADAAAADSAVPRSAVPGKARTLLAVLSIMALMAVGATIFVWYTKDFRRRNDYRIQKKNDPQAPPRPAADVAIVGLLPARCNVVGAVDVAELRRQPGTRRLLDEPPLGSIAGKVPHWTGLAWSDIEQIAVGAEIRGKLPQLFVLVQTRQPYSPAKVAAALAPATPTKHRQKVLVRFPLAPVGEGLLWCHSERVLVFVLGLDAVVADDLDAVTARPRPGLDGFPAPLRAALEERLPAGSACWLAGHFDDASGLADLLALSGPKNAALNVLLQTKTFVIGVQAQPEPTLTGHFFTGNAKSAARLQTLLESRSRPEAKSVKVAGPPPDVADPAAQWVTVQVRGDLAPWLGVLDR